jgi:GDP/UDP-N,N'-diacetylbacillosamine 2-epimerase (hydrolysing)
VESFSPDVIIYAGDREDTIVAALVGAYMQVPTVHFFGGDHAADGNVDNPVRHAISKLSSLHFVAHESHVQRLVKLGESNYRIFNIGSPALDKYINEKHISKINLLNEINCKKWNDYAVLIFHPILGQEDNAGRYFEEILTVLIDMGINAFVSYPNIDSGNKNIINIIDKYVDNPQFHFYKNMERKRFINLLRHASFLIGNSSTGILEAPIIPLGVVNVGLRQKSRFAAENVIFVDHIYNQIKEGIELVRSKRFITGLQKLKSPYGDGKSVDRAYDLIKKLDFKKYCFKKEDPLLNE